MNETRKQPFEGYVSMLRSNRDRAGLDWQDAVKEFDELASELMRARVSSRKKMAKEYFSTRFSEVGRGYKDIEDQLRVFFKTPSVLNFEPIIAILSAFSSDADNLKAEIKIIKSLDSFPKSKTNSGGR